MLRGMGHKGKQDKIPAFAEVTASKRKQKGRKEFPNNMAHVKAKV